jgi:hypothetical protein
MTKHSSLLLEMIICIICRDSFQTSYLAQSG